MSGNDSGMEVPVCKYAVLLSGRMGAGKDAAADILTAKAGFTRFALADPLRHAVLKLWPVMETMFGLIPRVQLSFASLTSQSTKNAPYLFRSEIVTSPVDELINKCELSRNITAGDTLQIHYQVNTMLVTRASFVAFFRDILKATTFQDFDMSKTEEAAVAFFNAFARMAKRDGEESTTLPLDPESFCRLSTTRAAVDARCPPWPKDVVVFSNPRFQDQPLTPRWILQWLGTDLCRATLSDLIWIQATLLGIQRSGAPRIVVSDMRFPNEAELLPRLLKKGSGSFHTLRLNINDPRETPASSPHGVGHISELHISTLPVDARLDNDKTLGHAILAHNLGSLLHTAGFPDMQSLV